jgi:hypothetical protein
MHILNATPIQDIIELRKGAQELLDANRDNYMDKDFRDKIDNQRRKRNFSP